MKKHNIESLKRAYKIEYLLCKKHLENHNISEVYRIIDDIIMNEFSMPIGRLTKQEAKDISELWEELDNLYTEQLLDTESDYSYEEIKDE